MSPCTRDRWKLPPPHDHRTIATGCEQSSTPLHTASNFIRCHSASLSCSRSLCTPTTSGSSISRQPDPFFSPSLPRPWLILPTIALRTVNLNNLFVCVRIGILKTIKALKQTRTRGFLSHDQYQDWSYQRWPKSLSRIWGATSSWEKERWKGRRERVRRVRRKHTPNNFLVTTLNESVKSVIVITVCIVYVAICQLFQTNIRTHIHAYCHRLAVIPSKHSPLLQILGTPDPFHQGIEWFSSHLQTNFTDCGLLFVLFLTTVFIVLILLS